MEKTVISSIWRLADSELKNREEVILPKGTIEIIFNFSESITYFNPSLQLSKLLPIAFVNGVNYKPFLLRKSGRQEFLGIQLKSVGLRLLFNISVKEYNDRVYDANEAGQNLSLLAEEIYYAQKFQHQVEIILKWVRQRISKINKHSVSRVQKLQYLSSNHHLNVKNICQEICLSDRQLRRFSLDWLGMNTEDFINYNKYLTSLQLLHSPEKSLTEVGLEAGYYDQSHFIREFKYYTELTPKQYRAAKALYPGHLPV